MVSGLPGAHPAGLSCPWGFGCSPMSESRCPLPWTCGGVQRVRVYGWLRALRSTVIVGWRNPWRKYELDRRAATRTDRENRRVQLVRLSRKAHGLPAIHAIGYVPRSKNSMRQARVSGRWHSRQGDPTDSSTKYSPSPECLCEHVVGPIARRLFAPTSWTYRAFERTPRRGRGRPTNCCLPDRTRFGRRGRREPDRDNRA